MDLSQAKVDPLEVQGTWHVVATTFPMWLAGDKLRPKITYSNLKASDGVARFDDKVTYEDKNGREHTIQGYDIQVGTGSFMWRGYGWLFFFKSNWKFIQKQDDYAVITFESTWVTPSGMDILCRRESMTQEQVTEILNALKHIPEVATHKEKLRRLN
jgi:hypothetical protein